MEIKRGRPSPFDREHGNCRWFEPTLPHTVYLARGSRCLGSRSDALSLSNEKNVKLRNIYLGLMDQLPWRRLLRNIRNGNIRGLIHIRSHARDDGSAKVMYNTKPSAVKAAEKMAKKVGTPFGNWKCFHCDGYHIGKNRVK